MYLLLLLVSAISSRAQNDVNIVCDGMVFNDKYYDKQMLFENFGRSYNLVMHERSGQLFFSHAIRQEDDSYRQLISCQMDGMTCKEVDGTVGGTTVFYHRENDDIYFGGYNGIYHYDFKTNSAKLVAETGKPMWGLFISDTKFYYITYPGKKLYVYSNNTFVKLEEVAKVLVENLFVTKHHVMYFSNSSGLYRVDKSDIPFYQPIILNDKITVRQIIDDYHGNVHFCAKDGIYVDDMVAMKLKKVADINDAYGITLIDLTSSKGQLIIIYSDKDAIYRLSPSKYSDYCLNSTRNVRNKTFAFSIRMGLNPW